MDPWMEGLQLDQVKLYEAGELDEKVWRIIRDNIRFPESSMGDLKSQIAACHLGEKRHRRNFRAVRQRDGAAGRSSASSTRRKRAAGRIVAGLRDGVYEAESLFARPSASITTSRSESRSRSRSRAATWRWTSRNVRRSARQPMNARTLAAAGDRLQGHHHADRSGQRRRVPRH